MRGFIAGLVCGIVLSLVLAGNVQAGRHNCKPAWKCQPAPTATLSATPPPVAGFTLNTYASTDFSTPAAAGTVESAYHLYAYPWGQPSGQWNDTSDNGWYDPGILSVHDGMLDFFIHTKADGIHRVAAFGPCLSAAQDNPVAVNCQQNQLYGAFEVRARVDSMHGYKGAWLHWPKSEVWPRDGEIDGPEADFDSGTVASFMHYQGAFIDNSGVMRGPDGSTTFQDGFNSGVSWNDWHVWRTEWTPSANRFYVDGRLYGTSTRYIPNTPMRWTIQNETTLDGFEPADSVSGHGYIDWWKVWSYN